MPLPPTLRNCQLLLGLALLAQPACEDSNLEGASASAHGSAAPGPRAEGSATTAPADSTALTIVVARARERSAEQPVGASKLIGTRVDASSGGTIASTPAPSAPEVDVMELGPGLKPSMAGTERDLRATLYYELVQQCRDEDGELLPPEAVELEFRVDPRGTIDRSSVKASAARVEHEAAARCMVRVVRSQNGRFGPLRVEQATPMRVRAKVPSVD